MAKDKKEKKGKALKEQKSLETDPNLCYGNGEFTLPNGDKYVGDYCAHRYGLIWREGHGTYITQDGQTYKGEWKDDKLIEKTEVTIKYPQGEEYHGALFQDKYYGAGTYTMDNQMSVNCNFFDNKPKDNIILVDINRRLWQGPAGETSAVLLPENEFYNSIADEEGIGKLKSKYLPKQNVSIHSVTLERKTVLSDREKEKIVFANSTKTQNDVDFTDSEWCKKYLRYESMKDKALKYLQAGEEEIEEEWTEEQAKERHNLKRWLCKFKMHKKQIKQAKQKKKLELKESLVDTSLLDQFYSKEYHNKFETLKVFYPTEDWKEKNSGHDSRQENHQTDD